MIILVDMDRYIVIDLLSLLRCVLPRQERRERSSAYAAGLLPNNR